MMLAQLQEDVGLAEDYLGEVRPGKPEETRKASLQLLHDLYHRSHEVVRFRIVSALASVPDLPSLGLLEKALRQDDSILVRHEAAYALGEVGDEKTVALLTNTGLQDPSYLVRHEAAMALASIGDASALPALEESLRDETHEVVVSCQLAINSIRYRLAQQA